MKLAGVFLFATVALGAGDGPAQRRRLEERYSKKKEIANSCSNQIVNSIGKLGSDIIQQFEGGCAGGRNNLVSNCNLFDEFPGECNAAYTQDSVGVKTACKCGDALCKESECVGRTNKVTSCGGLDIDICLMSYKENPLEVCRVQGFSCSPGPSCTTSNGCGSGGLCTNPDDEQRQALYDELLKEAVYTCCLNGNYFKSDDKAGYGDYGDYNSKTRAEECEDVANNLPDFLA